MEKVLSGKRDNNRAKPAGWWPEESTIDRLDKNVSVKIFSLDFGAFAELLLFIPGSWFGLPTSAFLMANFATWYSQSQSLNLSSEFVIISTFLMAMWAIVFLYFVLSDHVERVYKLNKICTIPSIVITIVLGRIYMPQSYEAANFLLASWMTGECLNSSLKTAFCRMRPVVAPLTRQKILSVHRAFPSYRTMLSGSSHALESFPSGDCVSAACFSVTLIMLKAPFWTFILCPLVAFCKMYFQAHHLLDTLAGLVLGLFVSSLLGAILGMRFFNVLHTSMISVGFIGFQSVLEKLKPKQ